MPAESLDIIWLLDGRVLLVDLVGNVSTETLLYINETICHHLDVANAPIHIIFNDLRVERFEPDIHVFSRAVDFYKHPNMGRRVSLRANRLVRFVTQLAGKLAGAPPAKYVKSLDEALTYLRNQDPTLPAAS